MNINQGASDRTVTAESGANHKSGAFTAISRRRVSNLLDEIHARAPGISLAAAAITAAWLDEVARTKATRFSATIIGLSLHDQKLGDFALSMKISYDDPMIWAIAETPPWSETASGSASETAGAANDQVIGALEKVFSKRKRGEFGRSGAMALASYFAGMALTRSGRRLFLHDNIGQTFDIRIRSLTRLDRIARSAADTLTRLLAGGADCRTEDEINAALLDGRKITRISQTWSRQN